MAAATFPRWIRQDWESDDHKVRDENNMHLVTIAIKHMSGGPEYFNGTAKYGQILSAASGVASIQLISTLSYADGCPESYHTVKHDGIRLRFEDRLEVDTDQFDDAFFTLTINGQEIDLPCKREARINKLRQVNKPGNIMPTERRKKRGPHWRRFSIRSIDISSRDSYTNELYNAVMHQYVQHHKTSVARRVKK